MKYIKLTVFVIGLLLFGCYQTKSKTTSVTEDKEQIQNLIRQVLKWSNSKESIDLLPVLADSKDSFYIGFDLDKHKANIDKLRETNFFTTEFIENYNQIILTLDRKLRGNDYEKWLVGELPTFNFANDVNPWCLCQDVPYDKPGPWDLVEVEVIDLNSEKGELNWKWGKTELNEAPGWKEFTYRFKVTKENGKWKIAYLQGFDFKESTRKDGP